MGCNFFAFDVALSCRKKVGKKPQAKHILYKGGGKGDTSVHLAGISSKDFCEEKGQPRRRKFGIITGISRGRHQPGNFEMKFRASQKFVFKLWTTKMHALESAGYKSYALYNCTRFHFEFHTKECHSWIFITYSTAWSHLRLIFKWKRVNELTTCKLYMSFHQKYTFNYESAL